MHKNTKWRKKEMKRKIVCGIILCLTLATAGCGKNSEEQQAANYYQNELGLDREDAEALSSALYGEDEEDEYISEEESEVTVVEPLPEFLNSEWYEQKVQIYDMIFSNDMYMTEADIRAAAEASAYNVELLEEFDGDGNIVLRTIMVDGISVAQVWKWNRDSLHFGDCVEYGLLDEGEYYRIDYGPVFMGDNWYDKATTEFADLGTRDDVLAYLAENSFVEVEESQAVYHVRKQSTSVGYYYEIETASVTPRDIPEGLEGIVDTPHYSTKGVQSTTLYRVHKLGETDQEVAARSWGVHHNHSGAHLNLVNCVIFEFDTDGTIKSVDWATDTVIIYGEQID